VPYGPPQQPAYVAPPYGHGPPYASWGQRLGAVLLDSLIVGVPFWIFGFVVGALVPTEITVCTDFDGDSYLCEQPTTAGSLMLLAVVGVGIAVTVGYLGWWQGHTGQTLGKRIVGLRVVHLRTYLPLGGSRGIGRYLGAIVSALPCYLGYLWPLWDDKNQAWHDKMVSSIVVKDPR